MIHSFDMKVVAGAGISEVPCQGCGGGVIEFSVQSPLWNTIVRRNEPERAGEYLCLGCFNLKLIEVIKANHADSSNPN